MTKRLISRVDGFVHDIETVTDLSEEPCNIVLLSDRSLYILQNLATLDITFLSRYGTIESNGEYSPVVPGSVQASTVQNAVYGVGSELTMANCIDDLVNALNGIKSALQSNSCGCEVGEGADTGETVEGGSIPDPIGSIAFEEPSAIADRKCKAANSIYETVRGAFEALEQYPVDTWAGLGLAFAIGTVTAIMAFLATPMVALIFAVGGGLATFVTSLVFGPLVSVSNIASGLVAGEAELVCALYSASNSQDAKDNFEAELANQGLTPAEVAIVMLLLTNGSVALLFFDTEESAAYWPTYTGPVDCSECLTGYGFWRIDPSGADFGVSAVGGGPMGTGTVSNDGSTFTISSVPTTSGQHGMVLEVEGYQTDWPNTLFTGGQVTLHSTTQATPFQISVGHKGTTCGNGMTLNAITVTYNGMPDSINDFVAIYYLSNNAFSIDVSIDTVPNAC